jgi:hypothetical protein
LVLCYQTIDASVKQEIVTTPSSSSVPLSAFGAPAKLDGQTFDTLAFATPADPAVDPVTMLPGE